MNYFKDKNLKKPLFFLESFQVLILFFIYFIKDKPSYFLFLYLRLIISFLFTCFSYIFMCNFKEK